MLTITKENILSQLPSDVDGLYKSFQVKAGTNKEKRLIELIQKLSGKKQIQMLNGLWHVGESVGNRELTLLEQARLAEGKK